MGPAAEDIVTVQQCYIIVVAFIRGTNIPDNAHTHCNLTDVQSILRGRELAMYINKYKIITINDGKNGYRGTGVAVNMRVKYAFKK